MGGRDKGLVEYSGKPLVDWVIGRLLPQVDELIVSANRNPEEYSKRGFQVLPDTLPGYQGPLAGLLTGLKAARHDWVLAVPCDVPHLPQNLAVRMIERAAGREAAFAQDAERTHPAILLMNRACLSRLMAYLEKGGRSVKGFLEMLDVVAVQFPDPAAFRNLNEADQLDD